MLTPTALMKPTMTALDTNRSAEPSLRNPAMIMMRPVTMARVNKARAGSLDVCTVGTSEMMTAIAPVAWTAMNEELVANDPDTVPNMYAYNPESGLTPASSPAANPSGTLSTPSTRPAMASSPNVSRRIRSRRVKRGIPPRNRRPRQALRTGSPDALPSQDPATERAFGSGCHYTDGISVTLRPIDRLV